MFWLKKINKKKFKKNKIVIKKNVNVAEEAVAEELLPYKVLFTSVVPGQDHARKLLHLVFVFTPAGQSCYDEFHCKRD